MGLIFNGNGDVIRAVDGSLTVEGMDFDGSGNINAGIGTFSDLNVTGVLTYEDVKNVDSVGIISARQSIHVGYGVSAAGIITATSYRGDGSQLTGIVADKIFEGNTSVETVDTGSDGHITFDTEGSERLRIDSAGRVQIGLTGKTGGDDQALVVANPANDGKILELATTASNGRIHFSRILSNTLNTTAIIENTEPGAQGTGDLRFYTSPSSNNPTERLRITADGPHLLLGGTSDVNEITESSGHAGMVIGGTGFGNAGLAIITSTTGAGRLYFGDNILSDAGRNRGAIIYYHSSDHMHFQTAGAERVRITSSGNIGVAGATGTDYSLLDGMVINTANGSAGLLINSSSSSHNAYLGFSYGSGSGTSHADQYSAYIGRVGDDTLMFGTANTERLRITSSGDVGIGYNSPTVKLHVREGASGFSGTYDNRYHITMENSGEAYLGFYVPDNQYAGIRFHDTTGCEAGIDYYYSSDSLQFYATDHQLFKTAGTERLRITSAGKFNIANPSSGNVINLGSSTAYANAAINIHRNGSGYADIRLASNYGAKIAFAGASDNTDEFYIQQDNQKNAYLVNEASGSMYFNTGNTNRFVIDASGHSTFKRSFNLTSTSDNHHVMQGRSWTWTSNGVSSGDVRAYMYGDSSGNLRIGTAGWNERLRISSTGSVGIGEASPDELLHITNGSGNTFHKIEASNIAGLKLKGGAGTNHIICDDSLVFFTGSDPSAAAGGGASDEVMRLTSTGFMQVQDSFNSTQGNARIWISKGAGSGAAPETINRANSYLHLGGNEWGSNAAGTYTLSFGYTNGTTGSNVPAYVGFKETSTGSYTKGDLVLGLKSGISDISPTQRMRITSDGILETKHHGNAKSYSFSSGANGGYSTCTVVIDCHAYHSFVIHFSQAGYHSEWGSAIFCGYENGSLYNANEGPYNTTDQNSNSITHSYDGGHKHKIVSTVGATHPIAELKLTISGDDAYIDTGDITWTWS